MTITLRPETLDTLMDLYVRMPEFSQSADLSVWQSRLENRQIHPLVAYVDGKPAGFKLGYALSDRVFYSWLGGVLPEYRRLGIAQQLLSAQEEWAQRQGYQQINVKTRNQFRGMLLMLIKNNYQLVEIEKADIPESHRLLLEKPLSFQG